jgi:hypothetical protein
MQKRADRSRSRDTTTKPRQPLKANHRSTVNPFSKFTAARLKALQQEFRKNEPFPYLSLPNFLDEDFLKDLKAEVLTLPFEEKSNDLYHFQQSQDLKKVTST